MKADVLSQLKEKNFASLMSNYQARDWVYPAEIHRKLQMDVETVYKLLEFLASKNYVTPCLELYCPNCKHSFYYKTLGELPSEISCAECGNEIADPISRAIVIYRVN